MANEDAKPTITPEQQEAELKAVQAAKRDAEYQASFVTLTELGKKYDTSPEFQSYLKKVSNQLNGESIDNGKSGQLPSQSVGGQALSEGTSKGKN